MDNIFVNFIEGLPSWFWPLAGIWELVAVAATVLGRFDVALPMAYIFLGGVVSSVTVLKSPSPKFPILPMPILTIGLTAAMGAYEGNKFGANDVYCLLGGFAFGVVMDQLGPGFNKSKSK
jgi:hypothetical protein